MADTKQYLDQTGLASLVGQIKGRYDGAFKDATIVKYSDNDDLPDGCSRNVTYIKFTGIDDTLKPFHLDASQFVKDGMLDEVSIYTFKASDNVQIPGYEDAQPQPGEKFIRFTWNTDAGKTTDYIKASEIGKVYSAPTNGGIEITEDDKIQVKAGKGVTLGTDGISVKTTEDITIDRTDTHVEFLTKAFGTKIDAGITFQEFLNKIARIEVAPSKITITDTVTYTQPAISVTWPSVKFLSSYTKPNAANYSDADKCILLSTYSVANVESSASDSKTGFIGAGFIFPSASAGSPTDATAYVKAEFQYGYIKTTDGTKWDDSVTLSTSEQINATTNYTIDKSKFTLKGSYGSTVLSTNVCGTNGMSASAGGNQSLAAGTKTAKYEIVVDDNAITGAKIAGLGTVGYKNLSSFKSASGSLNVKVESAYKSAGTTLVSKTLDNGSWDSTNSNDYNFKMPSKNNAAKSQDYVGRWPIFMNVIPTGTKPSSTGSRPLITASSLVTNYGTINMSGITYNSSKGMYTGSTCLTTIPNSYITKKDNCTTIVFGSYKFAGDFSTSTQINVPWLSSLGMANGDGYSLLIALPDGVTVSAVETHDQNVANSWYNDGWVIKDITDTTQVQGELTIGEKAYRVYDIAGNIVKGSKAFATIAIKLSTDLNSWT